MKKRFIAITVAMLALTLMLTSCDDMTSGGLLQELITWLWEDTDDIPEDVSELIETIPEDLTLPEDVTIPEDWTWPETTEPGTTEPDVTEPDTTEPEIETTEPVVPESEGLEFTSNGDGTCAVTGIGGCTDTDIVIPAVSPDGDIVTAIGAYAFEECGKLVSVTIPDSVRVIENDAFRMCLALTAVTLSNGLIEIENLAFCYCVNLASISIPDSVTSIKSSAFDRCSALASITVSEENSVYHSKDNCLIETASNTLISGCQTSIIPDYVVNINAYAFSGQINMTSITLPDSVRNIGEYAFLYCGLTSIIIPDNVMYIAPTAFIDCGQFTEIVVSKGNENYVSIGNCLIERESNTIIRACSSSNVPNGIVSIAPSAFGSCYQLVNLVLPNSVISIDDYGFISCFNLQSVTISNSITLIGYHAFQGCESITDVYFTGTEEEWGKIEIEEGNDYLLNATIHFNYIPES